MAPSPYFQVGVGDWMVLMGVSGSKGGLFSSIFLNFVFWDRMKGLVELLDFLAEMLGWVKDEIRDNLETEVLLDIIIVRYIKL